ncbi:hypothetical protein OESDEN_13195 [Oesophagostomum dentatum]|uniref:F-box domain protein n=1 Tax=Oesophagostomum dentatum TaxID=61180 RepID=A0A0B1SNX3_OESDE|nr:hypothetical protein OESDEN_13195 [Oesophagostomum dentatum]
MDDFEGLGFPKLSLLSLTAEASSMAGFNLLRRCPSLTSLYTGLRVPDNPTRFDLDVLLRCYQSFWNTSSADDEEDDEDVAADSKYVLSTLPKLQHVGFWNAPEKLFAIMARCGISFETLQFGQLNQSLSRLCSLDSMMQALFKFNQPKYDSYKLDVKHLRMYLHAMPVVSLDYYLPQLMMGINDFDDLDCHLPPCLTSVSISVSLPAIGASKSVASLLDFIKRLANVNGYPDLEELHVQVWGTRCAESLLNRVADHLSDIRRLSIIAMPVDEQRDRLIDLIRHVASSCPRLVSLQLSTEMTRLLLNEYGDLWRTNWRLAIAQLRSDCGIRDVCELSVGSLPLIYGCDDYTVTPQYPEVSEVDFDAEEEEEVEEEESKLSEDNSDSCSNDSFIVHGEDEEGFEESEDEIDECDRKLEKETEQRHERYLKRRARQPSTSSEDPTQEESMEDEDGSDVEYVTDYEGEEEENNQYGKFQHPLIDGEAEEVESGMESSDPSDAEPEGEDIVLSSDREMLSRTAIRSDFCCVPPTA